MLIFSIIPSNLFSKKYSALPTSETSIDPEAGGTILTTPNENGYAKSIDTSEKTNVLRILSEYTFVIGWIAMVLAIFSGAGSGPMFKYMEENGVAPSLAAAWRCQCMSIFLVPLAVVEIIQNNGNTIKFLDRKPDLPYPVYVHTLFAGLLWSGTLLLWINGLKFLTTTQASLIVNTHPLIMVFYMQLTGKDVSPLDWVGVVLSIAGVGVVGSDDLVGSARDSSPSMQLMGVTLCMCAAVCEFLVILNRKTIKKYVPLMQVRLVCGGTCIIFVCHACAPL